MTLAEILAMTLGSGFAGSVITTIINTLAKRKEVKASAVKLKNESGQIVLEGELKVTAFYKEQLEAILAKYTLLEKRLEEAIRHHEQCEAKIEEWESKYAELQRQFTLLKTKVDER